MIDLPTKYRPQKFADVIGHESIVKSLERLAKERSKHAVCLTGPSGTGKTTLARIMAKAVGVRDIDLLEIDAAGHSTLDYWKALIPTTAYAPMGPKGSARAIIVDECQRLSPASWECLLKAVEEPPSHLYWFFCSMEPKKVPIAIRNRCATLALGPVRGDTIFKWLDKICALEDYDTPERVLDMITNAAQGSPRQALAFLETCHDKDEEDAAELLQTVADDRKPTELAFGLLNKTLKWSAAVKVCADLQDRIPAEGIRRLMLAIMYNALVKRTQYAQAEPVMAVIEQFETPFASDDKAAAVLMRIGRLING